MESPSTKRIASGIVRPFTRSEAKRGYVYFSRDQRLGEVLDVDCFALDFCGQMFPNRRMDRWGRFQASTSAIQAVPSEASVSLSIVNRQLVRIEIVDYWSPLTAMFRDSSVQ